MSATAAGRAWRLAAVGVAALLVASCSYGRAKDAREARSALVGASRDFVLACAGQPQAAIRDGDLEYFMYRKGEPDYDAMVGRPSNTVRRITGADTPRYCRATVRLRNGIVEDVSYDGHTGGLLSQGEACSWIVGGCVPSGS